MGEPRLSTHIEVNALVRRVGAEGGFATVLARGERDAGTLLVVVLGRDKLSTAYERMPQMDGTRAWSLAKAEDAEKPGEFAAYLDRRKSHDPDLWIVELDVRDPERFVEGSPDS
jgi:hypothetical protein